MIGFLVELLIPVSGVGVILWCMIAAFTRNEED